MQAKITSMFPPAADTKPEPGVSAVREPVASPAHVAGVHAAPASPAPMVGTGAASAPTQGGVAPTQGVAGAQPAPGAGAAAPPVSPDEAPPTVDGGVEDDVAKQRAEMRAAPNFAFYSNRLKSRPHGHTIEGWHEVGWENYELLERHHSFIQWIFPTRTTSMVNRDVPPLNDRDVQLMKGSEEVGRRLIQSYRMMLDFYGMELVDERTGEVTRSPKYRERYYEAIQTSWHNHLRICRILSTFSVLGFRRYKAPLFEHLLRETGYDARGNVVSRTAPISLPFRPVSMWRTYMLEDSRDYVKFSGVKLPQDHEEHVLFAAMDAAAPPLGLPLSSEDGDTELESDDGADEGAGAGAGDDGDLDLGGDQD